MDHATAARRAIQAAREDHERQIPITDGLVKSIAEIADGQRSVWRRFYLTARHKLVARSQRDSE